MSAPTAGVLALRARQRSLRMSLITSSDWRSSALISTRLFFLSGWIIGVLPARVGYIITRPQVFIIETRQLRTVGSCSHSKRPMARRGITVMGARPCVNHALWPRAALQGDTFRSVGNAPHTETIKYPMIDLLQLDQT